MESKVYLALGSNTGRRRAHIGRAAAALLMRLPVKALRLSPMYENAPVGFESDNMFVNAVAELVFERSEPWSEADALSLLDAVQAVERSLSDVPHRNADGTYRDREIDIDIIYIERFSMRSSRLTVPHSQASCRPFVTVPLGWLGVSLPLGDDAAGVSVGQPG